MTRTQHHDGRGHASLRNQDRVFRAMLLTGGFMLAEVAGGLLSGSLALLADAAHMLTDTAALGLAWLAFRMTRKPADALRTYGYQRFQVLAAFVNGAALIAIVGWIGFEAVQRMLVPMPVLAGPMLGVATAGLLVNVAAFRLLHGGDRENLNIRGAALHVLGDMLGSGAAIVAALVILATGWTPIDPLLSLVVAALVLRSAWFLLRRSGHILLEGAPEHIDVGRLKAELRQAVPAVDDVHHVHAWSLTEERPLVTLHADVREGTDHHAVLRQIKEILRERFDVRHSTVQIEPSGCADEDRPAAAKEKPRQEQGGEPPG